MYRIYATGLSDPDASDMRVKGVQAIQRARAKLGLTGTVKSAMEALARLREEDPQPEYIGEHADRRRIEDAVLELQRGGIAGSVTEIEDDEPAEGDAAEPADLNEDPLDNPSAEAFQVAMVLIHMTGGPSGAVNTAAILARIIDGADGEDEVVGHDSFWAEVIAAILLTFPHRPPPGGDNPLAALLS